MILGKDFVLADTSIEVILGMFFFLFSNTDMGLQRAYLKELYNIEIMSFSQYEEV